VDPPTHSSNTFPSPASLGAEICFGLRLAYPAGEGSAAILRNMPPNSRRVAVIWIDAEDVHSSDWSLRTSVWDYLVFPAYRVLFTVFSHMRLCCSLLLAQRVEIVLDQI
jgi:hypothetical protein